MRPEYLPGSRPDIAITGVSRARHGSIVWSRVVITQ